MIAPRVQIISKMPLDFSESKNLLKVLDREIKGAKDISQSFLILVWRFIHHYPVVRSDPVISNMYYPRLPLLEA